MIMARSIALFTTLLGLVPLAFAKPNPVTIVNAASQRVGLVAPGMLISVFGTGLAEQTGAALPSDNITQIGSVTYLLSRSGFESRTGALAPKEWPLRLIYWSPTQLNAVVDADVEPNILLSLIVRTADGKISTDKDSGISLMTAPQAPGIFPSLIDDCAIFFRGTPCPSSYAFKRGIVTDLTGKLVTSENPAEPGGTLTVWLTGLGTSKTAQDSYPTELQQSVIRPTVWLIDDPIDIGNGIFSNVYNPVPAFEAKIEFAGPSPGIPGVDQINFTLSVPDLSTSLLCGRTLTSEMSLEIRPPSATSQAAYSNRVRLPMRISAEKFPCSPPVSGARPRNP